MPESDLLAFCPSDDHEPWGVCPRSRWISRIEYRLSERAPADVRAVYAHLRTLAFDILDIENALYKSTRIPAEVAALAARIGLPVHPSETPTRYALRLFGVPDSGPDDAPVLRGRHNLFTPPADPDACPWRVPFDVWARRTEHRLDPPPVRESKRTAGLRRAHIYFWNLLDAPLWHPAPHQPLNRTQVTPRDTGFRVPKGEPAALAAARFFGLPLVKDSERAA